MMIDLSYKPAKAEEAEPNALIQGLTFAVFALFLAVMVLYA